VRKTLAGAQTHRQGARDSEKAFMTRIFPPAPTTRCCVLACAPLAAGQSLILDGSYKRARTGPGCGAWRGIRGRGPVRVLRCPAAVARERWGSGSPTSAGHIRPGRVELFEIRSDFDPFMPGSPLPGWIPTGSPGGAEEVKGFGESYLEEDVS